MSASRLSRDAANHGSSSASPTVRSRRSRLTDCCSNTGRIQSVVGAEWGAYVMARPRRSREIAGALEDLIERGWISPIIGARYPLSGAADALRDLDSGAWEQRNADLLDLECVDLGARLLIAPGKP
jgi:hypothetical protein